MRAGGANTTTQHIEDLSLCGLFMMKVARKIDHQFGAHHTCAHTTLDACEDISKMSSTEKAVIGYNSSPTFADPTTVGLEKMCYSSWVKDILRKEPEDNLEREDIQSIDTHYELYNVV